MDFPPDILNIVWSYCPEQKWYFNRQQTSDKINLSEEQFYEILDGIDTCEINEHTVDLTQLLFKEYPEYHNIIRKYIFDVNLSPQRVLSRMSSNFGALYKDQVSQFKDDFINYIFNSKVNKEQLIRETKNVLVERLKKNILYKPMLYPSFIASFIKSLFSLYKNNQDFRTGCRLIPGFVWMRTKEYVRSEITKCLRKCRRS